MKKSLFYICLLIFCTSKGHGTEITSEAISTSTTEITSEAISTSTAEKSSEIIPTGTRMTIPSFIIEQYQAEKGWGMPFNYLAYNYAIPLPSTLIKEEGSYYVPLSYMSQNNEQNIVIMDLMNIKMVDENLFITIRDTYIIEATKVKNATFKMANNKIAITNKPLGNCLFNSSASVNQLTCYTHYYK